MRLLPIVGIALLSSAALTPSPADTHPTQLKSLVGVPHRNASVPGANALQYVCRLGQFGDPVGAIGDPASVGTIFFGENDTYWTYLALRPDSCAGCRSGFAGTLSTAHLTLYFPFAPETATVNVSVVASVPIPCHYPNTFDPYAVICAAFPASFDCQDPLTIIDFAIPIPAGCVIEVPEAQPGQVPVGAAFIGFEFVSASDTTTMHKPQIAVQAAGVVCTSYNPIGFFLYDLVAELGLGNPVMYAEVSRCDGATPVTRSSWGRLKLLYR